MEAGVHLPQLDLDGSGTAADDLFAVVDAARAAGFAAVSANDHLVFRRPWLDGLTALAAVAGRSGDLQLMTSVALPALRGPVPLAAAAVALDRIAPGRVVLGVGAGSSPADHAAVGVPFADRWRSFDRSAAALRELVAGPPGPAGPGAVPSPTGGGPRSAGGPAGPLPGESGAAVPDGWTAPPARIPVWIGSWGSPAGLRRVARLGDGWVASAYNCDPDRFAAAMAGLTDLAGRGSGTLAPAVPHALVTMWTWITDRPAEPRRRLEDVARAVGRDPADLAGRTCIGAPEECAELLTRYAAAGCRRVHFWPVADAPRQVERLANDVLPLVGAPG